MKNTKVQVHSYKDEHMDGIQIILPSGEELFLNKDTAEDMALMVLAKLKPRPQEKR